LAVGAVIEECREFSARRGENVIDRGLDRFRLGIVEIKALEALLVLEPRDVLRLARRGEHAPAARFHLTRRLKSDA
jgi:hypothetical protein